jgi:hypothetical protein
MANHLRDRGLSDDPPPVEQPPFWVDMAGIGGVDGSAAQAPVVPVGLPDDYAARLVALETAAAQAGDGKDVLPLARAYLAFLLGVDPPKRDTFTDE